jgi:hypothetical protein
LFLLSILLRFDSVRCLSEWRRRRRRRQTCTYYEKWQCDGIDKRHILIISPYTQVPENAAYTPCFWGTYICWFSILFFVVYQKNLNSSNAKRFWNHYWFNVNKVPFFEAFFHFFSASFWSILVFSAHTRGILGFYARFCFTSLIILTNFSVSLCCCEFIWWIALNWVVCLLFNLKFCLFCSLLLCNLIFLVEF